VPLPWQESTGTTDSLAAQKHIPKMHLTTQCGPEFAATVSQISGCFGDRRSLGQNFKMDITQRLTVNQTWKSVLTSRESGQYTHHAVTTLEFEIKRHLNLDVSYVWDYLHNPQPKSDGSIPEKSDTYLTVGFGLRF
jgi:hypothetical protein